MKEPNFFIIGAPKCGTTSLARWLAQHPEVFMSPIKEPHHFSIDFSLRTWRNPKDYRLLFEKADEHHKAVGEASARYLQSRKAVPRIEANRSDARYIVMLRNPVEMAPSLHRQTVFSGDEDIRDFEEAWQLEGFREDGKNIPPRCGDPKLVQYRRSCKLGEQLARLYDAVDCKRVHTVYLEDIQEDVLREWARILAFLDVSYWDDLEFRPENRAKHWRWPWVRNLQRFYAHTRRRLKLAPLGWGVFDRLQRISVKEAKREPLSEDLRRDLVGTFSDDIDLLAELTGRDLSHWKRV